MKRLIGNKKFFILISIVLVGIYLIFVYFLYGQSRQPNPPDLTKDYSKINLVVPGKDTEIDVKKSNGSPSRISTSGNKVYFFYSTPLKGIENKLLFKNSVLVYATENVYGDYRGKYSDYVSKNGEPDFTLYNLTENNYPWVVFLNKGVMISSSNNYIAEIIYFKPQARADFFKSMGEEFGFSEDNLNQAPAEVFGAPQ